MKKTIGLLFASAVLASSSAFAVGNGLYIRGDIGAGFNDMGFSYNDSYGRNNWKLKDSFVYGVGVGLRVSPSLRLDATIDRHSEAGLKQTYSSDGDRFSQAPKISSTAFLANIYYDVARFGAFTPYVGTGLGFSLNKFTNYRLADSTGTDFSSAAGGTRTSLAWQASIGTSVVVAPQWSLDVSYRYLNSGRLNNSQQSFGKLTNSDVRAGVRYEF